MMTLEGPRWIPAGRIGMGTTDERAGTSRSLLESLSEAAVLDRWGRKLLVVASMFWVLIPVAAVFLMSGGADEVCVLLGPKTLLTPARPGTAGPLVFSNGGTNTLVHLAIEWLVGSRLWVHRLPSLALLAGLLACLVLDARRRGATGAVMLLAVAPLIGLIGTAEIGTSALGTTMSTSLLFAGMVVWSGVDGGAAGKVEVWRVVATGLLLGLAAAARPDAIAAVPAVYLLALLSAPTLRSPSSWLPWGTLAVMFIAVAMLVANLQAHRSFTPEVARLPLEYAADQTGMSSSLLSLVTVYPFTLNRWFAGESFVALPWLVIASFAPFLVRLGEETHPARRRFHLILLFTGWSVWLAWHLRTPIPHLRYLWIGLACFAVLTGDALVHGYARGCRAGRNGIGVVCLLVGLGFVTTGLGSGVRSLVMADSDYASWEWSREMGADFFRRFVAGSDQRAATAYLRDRLPEGDVVVCFDVPYLFRYFTDRDTFDLGELRRKPPPRPGRAHLILTPAVGTYFYLSPSGYEWIAKNTRLEAEFGRYSIYEVDLARLVEAGSAIEAARSNYRGHPLSARWLGH
ncbi:MAG: hypothetical protein U0794_01715 [Isosphaeraceae bacterium]